MLSGYRSPSPPIQFAHCLSRALATPRALSPSHMRGSLLRQAQQTIRSAAVPPAVTGARTLSTRRPSPTFAAAPMATAAPRPPRPAAEVAEDMIKFIDASWTQFHAVGV